MITRVSPFRRVRVGEPQRQGDQMGAQNPTNAIPRSTPSCDYVMPCVRLGPSTLKLSASLSLLVEKWVPSPQEGQLP